MIRRLGLCLGALVLLAVGCEPRTRVLWSPDGRRAIVLAQEGEARLCDADGRLSAPLASGITEAAWTPDSKRIVVLRRVPLATWAEARALLSTDDQVQQITDAAKALKQEIMAHEGALDQDQEFRPQSVESLSGTQSTLAGMYLRDEAPDGLAEKMGESLWEQWKQMTVAACRLEVGTVADDGTVAFEAEPVVETLDGITQLRLSPDGLYVAWLNSETTSRERKEGQLCLMALTGGPRVCLSDHVTSFDWSPDGLDVVYGHKVILEGEDSEALLKGDVGRVPALGTVVRQRVIRTDPGSSGLMTMSFPASEDLAVVASPESLGLRCVGGAEEQLVLFGSPGIQLPYRKVIGQNQQRTDPPQPEKLFLLSSDALAEVNVAGSEQDLGEFDGFEVSPDRNRVLLWTAKGVRILSLSDGRIEATLDEPQRGLWVQPSWRSADEICLAVPAGSKLGSPDRAELILWSPAGVKVLSRSWDADTVKRLLLEPEQKSLEVDNGSEPLPSEEESPAEEGMPASPTGPDADAPSDPSVPPAAAPSADQPPTEDPPVPEPVAPATAP